MRPSIPTRGFTVGGKLGLDRLSLLKLLGQREEAVFRNPERGAIFLVGKCAAKSSDQPFFKLIGPDLDSQATASAT